ncbi:RNA polymerase sigma factor [bacterium]|nr:RNA polymerase sigma factor [bacterium]
MESRVVLSPKYMLRELQFKYLSRRHADDIYRFAQAILGNHADAQDVAQEVLIKLWKKLPMLSVGRMKSWLMTTTHRHCLDQIKMKKRRDSYCNEESFLRTTFAASNAPVPDQSTDHSLLHAEISQALAALPEKHQAAFVLHEVNGLKYRTIAETLDIPMNSVKVFISRARTKLQKTLRKDSTWIKSYSDGK